MKLNSSSYRKNRLDFEKMSKNNFFQASFVCKKHFMALPDSRESFKTRQLAQYLKRKKNKIQTQSALKNISLKSHINNPKEFESKNIFFNTCFDKNNLKTLIAWFLEYYGQKRTIDLVETLKQVGFHQATQAGVSLGIDDLQIPPQKLNLLSQASNKMENVNISIQRGHLTSVEKSQRLIDTWNQTSETLRQTAVHNFRITNPVNPVYMMAFSGARGNISQVRQLVAMRGLMADPQGAILEFPIQSNFREGLTVTEYLISCYGARKGLVDTALRTATSGYLTRRLVDAVQHVVVHVKDCGTTKGILLTEKTLEHRLLGRVLLKDIELSASRSISKNTLISKHLAKQLALKYKEILVRSPLTCETEKSVCQLCYGLDLAQGKLVSIGEAVGIIAAQSIGEPGTQLTMRTFHTGGVGVFSDKALKSFTAPFHGKIQFFDSLPGLFVRTPHGNIVYLLKHETVDKTAPLLRLISNSNQKTIFDIVHGEVPSGSILWVKQGENVKPGQLLLQASRLQTTTQEMPESSHPVRSPLSGEVFFQSMSIRIIEEEKRTLQKQKKKKQQNLYQSTQTEVSPIFPTLLELGNFWVFSSFIQKELGFAKSFFRRGDLISPNTPIIQYNLHLPVKGQLQKKNNSIILTENKFQLTFEKSYYSNLVYFLSTKAVNRRKILFCYTPNSTQLRLTCYPNLGFNSLVYLYLCPLETQNFNSKNENFLPEFFQKNRYIFSPYKKYQLKNFQFFKTKNALCSDFILSQGKKSLSESGFFQIDENYEKKISQKIKTQNNFLTNPFKVTKFNNKKNNFIKIALKKSQDFAIQNSSLTVLQNNNFWFYVSENCCFDIKNSQNTRTILEIGKNFEKINFQNFPVFTNSINSINLVLFKSENIVNQDYNFYSTINLFDFEQTFKDISFKQNLSKEFEKIYSRKSFELFCFYQKENDFNNKKLKKSIKFKTKFSSILSFQKTYDQILPYTHYLKENFLLNTKVKAEYSTNSPLFSKQHKTIFKNQDKASFNFKTFTLSNSGWSTVSQLIKVQLINTCSRNIKKFEKLQTKIEVNKINSKLNQYSEILVPNLELIFYQNFKLSNPNKFKYQTFKDSWILPNYNISSTFLRSKKLGELSGFQTKKNKIILSIIRNQDLISLQFPKENLSSLSKIGNQVRWGDELFSGFGAPFSGRILNWNQKSLTLQLGIPLLASIRGLIHISHNDFIEKDDLLITLRSRRLQTDDIVQGIPKIEQLFEARETQGGEIIQNNMHTLLTSFFLRARQVRPINEAVELSLQYIQKFLVENILSAYSTQGVQIAEKHVEVVVRQMTARVRIIDGGDTGLLPGEFVQIRLIEKVNEKLLKIGRRQAQYEPIILGITKSVLQSESFLLAASFQQVSKVLVRSALARKTDFLMGLHENVLVGQAIPAGTGLIDLKSYHEHKKLNNSPNEIKTFS